MREIHGRRSRISQTSQYSRARKFGEIYEIHDRRSRISQNFRAIRGAGGRGLAWGDAALWLRRGALALGCLVGRPEASGCSSHAAPSPVSGARPPPVLGEVARGRRSAVASQTLRRTLSFFSLQGPGFASSRRFSALRNLPFGAPPFAVAFRAFPSAGSRRWSFGASSSARRVLLRFAACRSLAGPRAWRARLQTRVAPNLCCRPADRPWFDRLAAPSGLVAVLAGATLRFRYRDTRHSRRCAFPPAS